MTRTTPLLTARVGPATVWCTGRDDGNVGDHVGDDPVVVARNRNAVARAAGLADPDTWVWMRQVHGVAVVDVDGPTPPGAAPEADAIVTATRGLPLAVVTADCAPIVLASDHAVAVVHAGHKGLRAGVIDAAVKQLRTHGDGAVHAFLGPCIHAPRYAFQAPDLAPLVEQFGPVVAARTSTGEPALDIPAAVRVALERAGVTEFADAGVCTSESAAYFSYRRDGATGRQVTIAVRP